MTIQPKFHWKFRDKSGATITVDSISKVKASLSEARPSGHGRIGLAMHLLKKNSHVNLGKAVGQFGTGDFTVAFGMKNISNHGDNELDIIGSQTVKGHGNFFSVRLSDERIFFHVDENSKGKHYVKVQTDRLEMVPNKTWFHIAVVRKRRTIQIYIDGVLSATAKSKTGVANIKNNTDVKLGDSRRGTPTAQYEDLRIYDRALDTAEIQALIPPINRPLRAGEIELVAADGAAVILKKDVGHLSRFSREFQTLRVGPDTRVSLFNKAGFEGTGQRLYADLPDIKLSRLKDFPASVRIRSAIGDPFTGKWLIKAPNGQFLSFINTPLRRIRSVLRTSPERSFNALFKLQQQSKQSRIQLIHDTNKETTLFRVSPETEAIPLFVEELRPLSGEFAIVNQAKNQWLEMGEKNTFQWTDREEKRAVFARVAKMADCESQVGELAPGEVALYQHVAYHGRTWILSDTEKDLSGEYPNLSVFQSLQDETSSIRLGPETGVTVFREDKFRGSLEEKTVRPIGRPPIIVRREEGKQSKAFRNIREKAKEAAEKAQEAAEKAQEAAKASLVEDIVENVPNLSDSQIGDDTISSLKIFRTVEPEDVFGSYTTKLSQDYKMVGNKLEEFSAYRTTLRFEPSDRKIRVEVSATDLTKIEVEGTVYKIDESRSVTLSPNEMNLIMITSEADGIDTPGLKIRTNAMALNERVVIFPNKEAHQQIAELEESALWNAKDSQGNLIVDREVHSQAEVASVQNTIRRMMATVAYTDEAPANPSNKSSARPQKEGGKESPRVQSSSRVVSGATIGQPWKLEFKPANNNSQRLSARAVSRGASDSVGAASPIENRSSLSASTPTTLIQEANISQDEFSQLLSQAIPEETAQPPASNLPGQAKFIKLPNPFKEIKDAVESGFSTVIGIAEGAVNVLVETAQGVFRFVVDTVKKVAEFVEAVVEKVVEKIKQFIEFLQFLFDWDDILDTQRYLVRAVNSGFDFATQAAKDAKPLVSAFVGNLQSTVEDGMNKLPELLGANPSEVEESDFEMPEAFEWFMSKLLGGSKQSDAKPATNSGKNPSEDSALESFFSNFLEALENAIGAGLIVSEGLIESIQKLIENPQQPQFALIEIIEALRDAIIQSLSAVENIALGLLDVVGEAIQQLKNLLNAEIKIPFISDLFKLIGAGKLTTLNLSTLLLAIPVTVISKITTNEKPFTGALPLEPSTKNQTRLVALTDTETQSDDNKPSQTSNNDNEITELRRGIAFTTITTMADTINHIINVPLDLIPTGVPVSPLFGTFELASLALGAVSWGFSVPFDRSLTFKQDELGASMETLLWTYRGGLLGADIITMIVGALQFGGTRRMRRLNQATIVVWGVLSTIDLGLAIAYLVIADEDLSVGIPSEIVAWIPNIAALSRLSGDPLIPIAVQGIANIVAVVSIPALGLVAIIKDAQALSRALKAA